MNPLRRVLAGLAFSVLSCIALAVDAPGEPILRIDPGMHTSPIKRLATDRDGRWLVTAGEDKTARVWDLSNGRQLQVLRPPQGIGTEGKLFAVALSPDGKIAVVSGWTQFNQGQSSTAGDGHSLYLFDRASGRLVRRLGGLPNVVIDLAFSADGRYLAATLGGQGIRVFRSDNWTLAGQDTDYAERANGVDFSVDGAMATTSLDGYIRLYALGQGGLRLIAKESAPGGKWPHLLRFSPDGRNLAVGFLETTAVNVLDAKSLTFRFAPSSSDVSNGDLASVAWSADGRTLYAAGKFWNHNLKAYPVRRWADGGRGQPYDEAGAGLTIQDIRSLPDGRMVYASSDPLWGVLNRSGRRDSFVAGPVGDFRDNHEGFQISRDGLTVRFAYALWGKSPAIFDLEHGLRADGASEAPLSSRRVRAPGIDITDWENRSNPTLNGTALSIQSFETSRCLAIAPDGESFVLGADWYLRRFDRSGRVIWRVPAPGVPWSVNISGDGRLVVAAYGDGTIRWHDLSSGAEKLAFFPHTDKTRWVAWTPSGYYAASPGGEELIGWHLNNGKDMAGDFFPASRFRSRFNRPDVVAQALNANSEAEAVRIADANAGRRTEVSPVKVQNILPPVVDIVSPAEGTKVATTNVTLRYRTRSPSDAPVQNVRARVNGQAVTTRNLSVQASGDVKEITIPVPQEDSEIQLFAENKNGVSTPATLRIKWAGARPAPQAESIFKPKLYVLAVGVSKYANPDYNLGLAAKDAGDFARVLQSQKGRLYADVQVRLLTDGKATKEDVLDGLEWLKREVTSKDVGIMFLAGHGTNDNQGNYYFLPHNADVERLLRTGVPQNDIKLTLNSLAGKAVFFVDTCHSGNVLGTAKTRAIGTDINAFVNELSSAENGVVVFTAATGRQFSLEDAAWGNGAFTKAVVEGLSGRADFQKNGKITHQGLNYYVAERVKELTHGKQTPVAIAPTGVTDFPIAVIQK